MRWESASGGGGCAGGWAAPGGGIGRASASLGASSRQSDDSRPAGRRRLGRAHLLPPGSRGAHSMGMVAPSYFTAEQARALPDDGNRYEVVYGELLVTPAPRPWHQEVVGRLSDGLRAYLRQEPVGHLFQSPADISLGSRHSGPAGPVRGPAAASPDHGLGQDDGPAARHRGAQSIDGAGRSVHQAHQVPPRRRVPCIGWRTPTPAWWRSGPRPTTFPRSSAKRCAGIPPAPARRSR